MCFPTRQLKKTTRVVFTAVLSSCAGGYRVEHDTGESLEEKNALEVDCEHAVIRKSGVELVVSRVTYGMRRELKKLPQGFSPTGVLTPSSSPLLKIGF